MIYVIMIKTRAQLKPLFKRQRDDYARKLKREKLINYLQSELRSCTTHGLPYLVNEEIHWLERVYWAINFVICCGVIVLLLSSQYSRYIGMSTEVQPQDTQGSLTIFMKNTPVVMSLEMNYFDWNVSYPAITLCPSSRIDQELFSSLLNETRTKTGKKLHSYYWSIATASIDTVDQMAIQNPDIVQLVKTKDYSEIAAMLFEAFDNNSLTTNTNWPISVQPILTEMGMCHVLNSNVAVYHNPIKWKDETTAYVKNNIELSAHDVDFFTQIMNYADEYKVYVHSPDEVPITTSPSFSYDVDGFFFLGYHVWVAKISDTLRHFPINIRRCRFLYEPMSERYPIYTYNHCMLDCRINMIIMLCGCVPHFYKTLDHETICDFTQLLCVIKYKNEIIKLAASNDTLSKFANSSSLPRSSHDCACHSPCESEVYLKDIENFLPQSSISRMRVSISTFPKIRVKREFIFSVDDMLLKTGGVINLCIGSSVISIMELIIAFIRIPLADFTDWVMKKIKEIKYRQ